MLEITPIRTFALALIAFGLLCNTVTLVVYLKNRRLRKPINFFLIALTFSDQCMLLISLTGPYIRDAFPNQVVCDCVSILVLSQTHFSVNCFAATAVLRYIHIVHPAVSKKILSWKMCIVLTVFLWIEDLLIVWPLMTNLVPNVYLDAVGYCLMDFKHNLSYTFSFAAVELSIPFIIITSCYISILVKRVNSRRRVQANRAETIGQQGQTVIVWKKTDLRLFWQVLCLVMIFAACWTPVSVLALATDFRDPKYSSSTKVSLIILLLNISVNPIVYFVFNMEFRKEIKRLVLCWKPTVQVFSTQYGSHQSKTNEPTTGRHQSRTT